MTRRAEYWSPLDDGALRCELCPHRCRIAPGHRGVCRIRENRDGVLYAAAYGETVSLSLDPIEKKPLYHFHPGGAILSVGANGCNLSCVFCQNHAISQGDVPTRRLEPAELAETADRPGSLGVAFTYTEPLVWFEYVKDCAGPLHERGLALVCVSNAYLEPEPFAELSGLVDAFNFDLKSFRDGFYRELCGGSLAPVLANLEAALASPAHVEITNLLIPGENDDPEELHELCAWLAERDPAAPLHFSRYHPAWKLDAPPTPERTLLRARETAREAGLRHVYLGNLALEPGANDTRCTACGAVLVKRGGYRTTLGALEDGRCAVCGATAPIVS